MSSADSMPPAGPANESVAAYRDEPHVAKSSTTETFVALKLLIDNWRWADVPFYLRTGKRLPTRVYRDRGAVPARRR